MDPYTTNGGVQQPQPPTNDANPTRYFPPQETPRPETPNTSPYNGNGNGAANASQQAGYAPPNTNGAPPPYGYPGNYANGNGNSAPYSVVPAHRHDRDRTMLGVILVGVGALFILSQLSFLPGFGDMALLLIGGVFLYAYFTTRPGYRVGFLIPGAILTGIGAGQVISSFLFMGDLFGRGSITSITLGLGFCMIWFFERRHWWALIPGGIILLGGLSSALKVFALWPLVLIALGVYLLFDQSRRRRN